MKTVVEMFGDGWRAVDAKWLDYPERNQYFTEEWTMQERRTFGMGATAILRALCRLDDGHMQRYTDGKYRPLRTGMFTLEDMAVMFVAWLRAERYIYGFGRGCGELMKQFFAPFLDGDETPRAPAVALYPVDVPQIFAAIVDAVEAAERLPVRHAVGGAMYPVRDQILQNIGTLARAGYEITRQVGMTL
ncbi:MAG TPA: hypothetical protein PKH77_04995 [Anaerolineae bacterium]|nr:hypothetical protein [Anaerolineae bacterium]